jgi:hypothetical protein
MHAVHFLSVVSLSGRGGLAHAFAGGLLFLFSVFPFCFLFCLAQASPPVSSSRRSRALSSSASSVLLVSCSVQPLWSNQHLLFPTTPESASSMITFFRQAHHNIPRQSGMCDIFLFRPVARFCFGGNHTTIPRNCNLHEILGRRIGISQSSQL